MKKLLTVYIILPFIIISLSQCSDETNEQAAAPVTSTPVTSTPVFSMAQGRYCLTNIISDYSINLSTTTEGAEIWYTLDGTDPSCSPPSLNGNTVTISSTTTIKAIGCAPGYTDSETATALFTLLNSKKTFITAATFPGDLTGIGGASTGIDGADNACMADANYPGTGTYKALIADTTNRIASLTADTGDGQTDWVLTPDTCYFRSDNTTLIAATNGAALINVDNESAMRNSFGDTAINAWFGATMEWVSQDNTYSCYNWTNSVSGSHFGLVISIPGTDTYTFGALGLQCNESHHLVCVEQ